MKRAMPIWKMQWKDNNDIKSCKIVQLCQNNTCWKNRFEHNKLVIFELKLQWAPQIFFGGSTWECVLLHEEMKIIY